MIKKKFPELKPLFLERMKLLLGNDSENYFNSLKEEPLVSIRCNTLKISPEKLLNKLKVKGWIIKQPFSQYEEVMIIENNLQPGELGSSLEHLLGYYYIQDISSMLSVFALNPKPRDIVLDLTASPGSKTTQIAAKMQNTGTIIANDHSLQRIKILASNLERCGVMNVIITRKDGVFLCKKFLENGFLFNKILVDAPCSGEGTLKSNSKTALMWNINTVKKMSKIQKNLLSSAIEIIKKGGELVYSTCTHAPEENEEVIDFVLKKFNDKINLEKINLPVKYRPGLTNWDDKEYNKEVEKSCRIYPQDNNTEGFFLAKIRRVK